MFNRKAARIRELEAACSTYAAEQRLLADSNETLARRVHKAESDAERRKSVIERFAFADSLQELLGAFGSDGAVNELDVRNAFDRLDTPTLVTLLVRLHTAGPRVEAELERRRRG